MKFRENSMYKHLYRDQNTAFMVDEILSQGAKGADLIVTWYTLTDSGRYVSMGVQGEFHVSKDNMVYYIEF